MNRYLIAVLGTLLAFVNFGCGRFKVIYRPAPVMVCESEPDCNTPGFWVSKYKNPNKIIMTAEEIKNFNSTVADSMELLNNIVKAPALFSEQKLYKDFTETIRNISREILYSEDGKKVTTKIMLEMTDNFDVNDLSFEGICKYALVTRHSNLRLLPSKRGLYKKPDNRVKDELQIDTLEIGTPLAIMHESWDEKWCYAASQFATGWIELDNIAYCEHKTMKEYCEKTPFVIVTKAKGELFSDSELTSYCEFAKMGTRLPIYNYSNDNIYKVLVPTKTKDNDLSFTTLHMNKKDTTEGYLAYTPKNIVYLAFEMLNAPYASGNKFASQDSSKFICQVFSCVGVVLPDNFSSLSKAGRIINKFETGQKEDEKKDTVLKLALEGSTILTTNDQVMLYLGKIANRPFVIHEITGYEERTKKYRFFNLINRVVVSDLSLGSGSSDGSLLKRLDSIREIAQ